jgi:hypothetical protein
MPKSNRSGRTAARNQAAFALACKASKSRSRESMAALLADQASFGRDAGTLAIRARS